MQIEFWEERWEKNQIAFHLPGFNPYLTKYLARFDVKANDTIFIPLCGKTLDIAWLASQQFSIIGVECSDKALRSFFTENNLQVKLETLKSFNAYNSDNICLLKGDFFELDKEILKDTALVYDRASLIALPKQFRKQYVSHMNKILPENAEVFLITLEYDQTIMSGPPFSVDNKEIETLYQSKSQVTILSESDVLNSHQKFKDRGLTYLIERIYRISN